MTTTTYIIDAAHGADDVAVCDWNTRIEDNPVSFSFDPSATGLKMCAPGTRADGGLDDTTTRAGVLFRGITMPEGETVQQATLRLYLTDWDPTGFHDPVTGDAAPDTYWLHIHGAARFAPAPGYNEYPDMDAVHWGNLSAAPCISKGTGVRLDGMTTGAGGPTEWGAAHKPGWPGGTRMWYPSRFDSAGLNSFSMLEIGRRTAARVVRGLARGPAGYVDFDVSDIVREIIGFDRTIPAWTPGTYSFHEPPSYNNFHFAVPPCDEIPAVVAPSGYVYTYCGNGIPIYDTESWGSDYGALAWPLGDVGVSNTAPTGTTIGANEQPDGPGTAIWRCARYGQPRQWQSGDRLPFVILQRPAGRDSVSPEWLSYLFPEQTIPGWRTFASGDLGDAGKYPTLVVETAPAGAGSVSIGSTFTLGAAGLFDPPGGRSDSLTLDLALDATHQDVADEHLDSTLDLAADATHQDVADEGLGSTLDFSADAFAMGAAVYIARNFSVGLDRVTKDRRQLARWLPPPTAITRLAAKFQIGRATKGFFALIHRAGAHVQRTLPTATGFTIIKKAKAQVARLLHLDRRFG